MPIHTTRPARWLQLLACVAMLATACTALPEAGSASSTAGGSTSMWSPPREGRHSSYIGTANVDSLRILESPGGIVVAELQGGSGPLVVALLDPPGSTTHLEVLIPGRPNGHHGWVHRDDIDITWTNYRIRIELSKRQVALYDGAELVVQGQAAIGTAANPTPVGRTFVTETLVNPDAGGMYGPYALGLALWSDTLTEYAGGDGQIGLHGTHRPDLLGEQASHGCVRVHNDLIRELAGRIPLGTPVDIIA